MGSVRQRLGEPRHECNVVLAGDCRVGKTALVNRFISKRFSETYKATSFEKQTTSAVVANRRVKYCIWDTTGSHSAGSSSRSLAYREADVFLLCYKITDPSTLFSALNHWCPEIRAVAPTVPIILVGCQSDLRRDRDILAALAKHGKAPISAEQALTFTQQVAAQMYVETSARVSTRNAVSAFEVAALASMGKLSPMTMTSSASSPSLHLVKKQRFSSISPEDSLEREDKEDLWSRLAAPSAHPKTPSLGSSSRSASLKTRSSSASIPSISSCSLGGSKTPKLGRRSLKEHKCQNPPQEKMITIKCQRLTADKTYEEIEVEVPAPIYETIQLYNDTGSLAARNNKQRRSFGAKLRSLFNSSSKS